jgi:hypothetical protein
MKLIIDPAQKNCIVLPHPSDKNKSVARVGHPNSVAIHEGRGITNPMRAKSEHLAAPQALYEI